MALIPLELAELTLLTLDVWIATQVGADGRVISPIARIDVETRRAEALLAYMTLHAADFGALFGSGGGGLPDGNYGDVTVSGSSTVITINNSVVTDTKVAAANKDGAAGTASMRTLGTGATQACAGNDSRLSDSRAPTAHTHPQSDITNLTSDLALKAPLASPALTGNPTAPTQAAGTNNTRIATTAYADASSALAAAGVGLVRGVYGDGSDGALTVTTGVTHTLAYNEFRTDVTVDAGGVIDCNGFILCVNGTLTINGEIHGGTPNPGNNGNVSSGAGGAAVSGLSRYLGVNGAGGTGGISTGGSVALSSTLRGSGGVGGAGGAGGVLAGNAGGAGGAKNYQEVYGSGPRQQPFAATGIFWGSTNDTDKCNAGSGGGGGGGHTTTAASGSGGGGGAGGLPIVINAAVIVNNATPGIHARGAAGGNGTGTDGGGGGGGGGGQINITCESYSGSGTIDVSGGAGGTATGVGVAGSTGNDGEVIFLKA